MRLLTAAAELPASVARRVHRNRVSGSTKGDTMGSAVLGEAITAIRDWSVTEAKEPRAPRATDAFGSLVFNDAVQQSRLPKPVYHARSEEHTSELQSHVNLVCRLLLEKKKNQTLLLFRKSKSSSVK